MTTALVKIRRRSTVQASSESKSYLASVLSHIASGTSGAVPPEQESILSLSSEHIRPVDQCVLDLLRRKSGLTVQELIDSLEVTATAVRQRLERLTEAGLIERRKESVGRGRPSYRYVLTSVGMRYASASYSDLATALWQEIMELPNALQRTRILRRVARRMASDLKAAIPEDGDVETRVEAIASALEKRKVPVTVKQVDHLPVLEVLACPYPELTTDDSKRHLCELEQEMFSEVMGKEMKLECCQLDGHDQCNFKVQGGSEPAQTHRTESARTQQ